MVQNARIITGRVISPRTVELDEAIEPTNQPVEVRVSLGGEAGPHSIPALLDHIRSLRVRGVPKEKLDRQLQEERESWGD